MAITAKRTALSLRVRLNYGIQEDGSVKTTSKTYANLNPNITDEQIVAGAKGLGLMLDPALETISRVETTQLVEG
jgi:hypothetical protein